MRIGGECAALSGFEIHHVVAERAAVERERGVLGFMQQGERDPETGIGGFGAADRLEHQIDRGAALDGAQRCGDVGEHAGLRGDGVALADRVEHGEQRAGGGDAVGGGVDADHRIAGAEQQAIER
jgi:hypothetical protein